MSRSTVNLRKPHFHIGHNIAGYMPETDGLAATGPAEAWELFKSYAREYADTDDDATADAADGSELEDDAPAMLATVSSILADMYGNPLTSWAQDGFSMWVEDGRGRPIVFFVGSVRFEDCPEDCLTD